MARPQPAHPDHASEQAYIEAAYRALEKRRGQLDRSPAAAPDKVTARAMRKQVMARLQEPVDLDSICFGRIDTEDGKSHYLGRQLIPGEKLPLVINWQVPAAAPSRGRP